MPPGVRRLRPAFRRSPEQLPPPLLYPLGDTAIASLNVCGGQAQTRRRPSDLSRCRSWDGDPGHRDMVASLSSSTGLHARQRRGKSAREEEASNRRPAALPEPDPVPRRREREEGEERAQGCVFCTRPLSEQKPTATNSPPLPRAGVRQQRLRSCCSRLSPDTACAACAGLICRAAARVPRHTRGRAGALWKSLRSNGPCH